MTEQEHGLSPETRKSPDFGDFVKARDELEKIEKGITERVVGLIPDFERMVDALTQEAPQVSYFEPNTREVDGITSTFSHPDGTEEHISVSAKKHLPDKEGQDVPLRILSIQVSNKDGHPIALYGFATMLHSGDSFKRVSLGAEAANNNGAFSVSDNIGQYSPNHFILSNVQRPHPGYGDFQIDQDPSRRVDPFKMATYVNHLATSRSQEPTK